MGFLRRLVQFLKDTLLGKQRVQEYLWSQSEAVLRLSAREVFKATFQVWRIEKSRPLWLTTSTNVIRSTLHSAVPLADEVELANIEFIGNNVDSAKKELFSLLTWIRLKDGGDVWDIEEEREAEEEESRIRCFAERRLRELLNTSYDFTIDDVIVTRDWEQGNGEVLLVTSDLSFAEEGQIYTVVFRVDTTEKHSPIFLHDDSLEEFKEFSYEALFLLLLRQSEDRLAGKYG